MLKHRAGGTVRETGEDYPLPIGLTHDTAPSELTSGTYTAAVAGTVYEVAVPDWARAVVLRPSADVRIALGEDPAAEGVGALTVGATIRANVDSPRILQAGEGRILRWRTATAGATLYVEFVG